LTPNETPIVTDLRDLSVQLLTTIGGMVTSLATVGLNTLVAQQFHYDFLSLCFWFVLPAGACCGGMAAASGYYVTARLTQTMPSPRILWNMLAVGVSTWALVQWLPYATLSLEDGTRLADVMSFWDYFKVSVESTQLTLGSRFARDLGTTGELGSLGYVREALQLFGFILGGFSVYIFLSDVEACQACRRYAKTETLLKGARAKDVDALLQKAEIAAPSASSVATQAYAVCGSKPLMGINLMLCRCPGCSKQWLRPIALVGAGREQTKKKLRHYPVEADAAALLRSGAAAGAPSRRAA